MKRARTWVCWAYALIAVAALVITYRLYLPFPSGGLVGFWDQLRVNRTARGTAVDLFFFFLAAALFMVGEARRLKIRFVWLYLLAGYLIDISVAFPVFMIMRERAAARTGEDAASFTITDLIVIAASAGLALWQVWFFVK